MTGIRAEIAEEEEPTSASSGGAPHAFAVGCIPCPSACLGSLIRFYTLAGSPAFGRQRESGGAAHAQIATYADEFDLDISAVLSRDRVSTAELQLGTIQSGKI
jgi:hypothetical protein